jgi:hypothetical protein
MKHPEKQHITKIMYLLGLLLLPLTSMADSSIISFFTPPASDISLQVMQNIFGTGTDALNGKLIRPLLMVFSSGIVIFMGGVFAWNLTKFVLHTAQEGEMMVGKGKQMGLVVLRSVFGISMVIPMYTSAYKGLSLSFVVVAWLITQGIGLADRGVNAVVDYLAAGGTIYQIAQNAKDTNSKQDMAKPMLDVLASQVCVYQLRQFAKENEAREQENDARLKAAGLPVEARPAPKISDVGYYLNADVGKIQFGTRNKDPNDATNPYFAECGTVNWPVTPGDSKQGFIMYAAMSQVLAELDPIAANIAKGYPAKSQAAKDGLDAQIYAGVANSIIGYSNMVAPLRVSNVDKATQDAYNALQSIKQKGWLALGAYYPMMGNLNQNNKQALSAYSPTTTLGALSSGGEVPSPSNTVYDFGKLQNEDKTTLKDEFKYIASTEANTKAFIAAIDQIGSTLQEELAKAVPVTGAAGPFQGLLGVAEIYISDYLSSGNALGRAESGVGAVKDSAGKFVEAASKSAKAGGKDLGASVKEFSSLGLDASLTGLNYAAYGVSYGVGYAGEGFGKFFGTGGNASKSSEVAGSLLSHDKLTKSASIVGVSTALAGPMAWVSIPPMLIIFVDIIDKFRVTIDQSQNADPLLALQDFGFYVMGKAVLMFAIIFGGTFVASTILAWIPCVNAVGVLGASANLIAPIIAMFFAAMAAAGIGFGIYIPMIPFIVWVSAILGWVGHSFQAIIGAPLVALRMTTAEGEGVLGGATEGVMMLLGVLLTPFLLVVGFSANLILIKQLMIVVNYLFSLFAYYSFGPYKDTIAWIILGVPAILMVYFTLITSLVQALSTKLIGEFPGEVLRHLHTAMTGHKAAEQMMGKMEQSTDKAAGQAGDISGKGSVFQQRDKSLGELLGGKKGGGGGKGGGGDAPK